MAALDRDERRTNRPVALQVDSLAQLRPHQRFLDGALAASEPIHNPVSHRCSPVSDLDPGACRQKRTVCPASRTGHKSVPWVRPSASARQVPKELRMIEHAVGHRVIRGTPLTARFNSRTKLPAITRLREGRRNYSLPFLAWMLYRSSTEWHCG